MDKPSNTPTGEQSQKSAPLDDIQKVNCSFCGKCQDQVDKIIAGKDVYICDQCVDMCVQILESDPHESDYKDFLKDDSGDTPEIIAAKVRCVSALLDVPKKQIPAVAIVLENISEMIDAAVEDNTMRIAAQMKKTDTYDKYSAALSPETPPEESDK